MENKKKQITKNVMNEISAVTPIFAVSLITKTGKKQHFANFYGTTINYQKGLDQAKVEAEVQKNDAKIFGMIEELEQRIKTGDFKKVKSDLLVEVNWAQFGGFMHKDMAKMEDAISCSSVERAFDLFKREYSNVGKTEKQIMDEKLKAFKKSLNAMDDDFLEF